MNLVRRVLLSAAAPLLATTVLHASVRPAALFSDHAVLQRDLPLPVWGWASPGERVTVTLGGVKGSARADSRGKWTVRLPAQPASTTPLSLVVAGTNTVTVRDILLGDVWLCSGQSNMELPLGACNAPEDVKAADFPNIRMFGVEYHFANTPQKDVKGQWQVCTPDRAPGFTAVGFYFARKVQAETGVPIGLLRSCVGGTNIELWMARETLMGTPALAPFARQMRESLAAYQKDLAGALPVLDNWSKAAKTALGQGKTIPMPPDWPVYPFSEQAMRPRCVTLHNGMIAPLVPFALRGALWYQGENNAGNAADGDQYIEKMRALTADWRRWFGNPTLPFYYVQLASWQKPNDDPAGGDGWAFIRDAQRRGLAIPHTGMALAIDIGDADDIHPKDKRSVGERLALWALANEYGKLVEPSGPLFRAVRFEGGMATVTFDHVGSGLMARRMNGVVPIVEDEDRLLRRFAIAGADRVWHWANARILGDAVVCTSSDVPAPVAVRYAFSMNPAGANLYNREGLPASPFRTDNW